MKHDPKEAVADTAEENKAAEVAEESTQEESTEDEGTGSLVD